MKRRQKAEKQRFLDALEQFPIIQAACKQAGISRATFYRWFQEDPQFEYSVKTEIKIGTESINDLAESQLIRLLKDGNLPAIKYWLGHRHPGFKEEPSLKKADAPRGPKTEQEQAEATTEIVRGVAKSMQMGLPAFMEYFLKKKSSANLFGQATPRTSADSEPHPDDQSPSDSS